MSWRTTGILFVVLVVLGGIVYLQSRQNETEEADEPTPAFEAPTSVALFDQVAVEDVVRLDVGSADGAEASFTREPDGGWFMTVPTATTVISQTVTNLVSGLINTGSRRTLAPDENPLDAYGLAEPAREIVVAAERDGSIRRYRLEIGNETPAGDAYYVLKEGDRRVHLMTKSTLDGLLDLADNPPLPETLPTPMPESPTLDTPDGASPTPEEPTAPTTITPSPSP